MNIQDRLKRCFKFRFAILYPLGILAILFAIPSDDSIREGVGFIIAGLFTRVWANCYAIKLEKLTTSGPYAFVRHPLYLGTMLLVIGFSVILRIKYFISVPLVVLIAVVYYMTIKREEKMLTDKFGQTFIDYKQKVPAMLPTIFPYRKGEKWPFSFKRLIKSQEYKLFLWMIVLIIVFHLKDEFITEHENMDTKIWQLIIVAFIFGMLDLLGEFIKTRKKTKTE